jgi:hypothetical protein
MTLKQCNHNRGFTIMIALIIGTVLLVLSVVLYTFVSRQYTGMHIIVNGEIAHFLAETGINTTIGTIRERIGNNLNSGTKAFEKLKDIFLNSKSLDNICINDILGDSWNSELKKFSSEVDKTASIEVNVYLKDFKPIETNPGVWCDSKAVNGWLVIESVGEYKGSERKIKIKRAMNVFNMVPGVMSKFTLYLNNSTKKNENDYNLIRNDYKGMITDGPQPLILYNHATPEYPFEPGNIADILKEEKESDVWKQRGWIWLKGNKTRLNLCSGAGDLGEIFHFYDVSNPNVFTPVRFATPVQSLPDSFFKPITLPWDKSNESVKNTPYRFWHSFVLDSFHDRSKRMQSDAMYEGDVLSAKERNYYGAKSSVLHLFGDARQGYQSRTRVIGPVYSAFVRFANLEVKPEEAEVKEIFENQDPKPIYLLRSIPEESYNNSLDIKDFMWRRVGGPLLKIGMLFKRYEEYANLMSCIVEMPYVESYNTMQDVYDKKVNRTFPTIKKVLNMDNEGESLISRDNNVFYKGKPAIEDSIKIIRQRVQDVVTGPADFWKKYLNENGELELNNVVVIKNTAREEFTIPPVGSPQPLVVKGGGIILLEKGNISLRGISLADTSEILTVATEDDCRIRFESTMTNMVDIIAPNAEVDYGSKFGLFGSLCAKTIYADHRFQGGVIRYRAAQDPTKSSYDKFYKILIAKKDSYWNE